MPALILIVEDEVDLAQTLAYRLRKDGHEVEVVHGGGAAMERMASAPLPGLVLLDLMLPDISGIEVCRRLRDGTATRRIPVLMLTARGEEIDRVIGFEAGADDYVVKPFSPRELALRVRALLRRSEVAGVPAAGNRAPGLRLEREGCQAWMGDVELELTPLEFGVLALLIERRGRFQSRDTLLHEVWGIDVEVTTRTVDSTIKRLRRKLGPLAEFIETRRGIGYRYCSEPPA